ncbi:hypothetical protein Tco_0874390 [Tanacetum coccineum]|uniref:Uncharacterized protein n=1 Tax=Tanacetum coccineum TaxID=301880 RepID=A0ABQ5BS56_9ASTR
MVEYIVDEDLQEEAALVGEQYGPPAPKTAKQLTAKKNQERVNEQSAGKYLMVDNEAGGMPTTNCEPSSQALGGLKWSLEAMTDNDFE